jgi:uncharacterized protein with HEPN domain
MSSDREYIDYIQDIISSCKDIKLFVTSFSKEDFENNIENNIRYNKSD